MDLADIPKNISIDKFIEEWRNGLHPNIKTTYYIKEKFNHYEDGVHLLRNDYKLYEKRKNNK